MRDSHSQIPTRAVIIAIAAGVLVATATMLLPVSVLESMMVTSGLVEMGFINVPLQDEVRAFMAFALGAITLLGVTGLWHGGRGGGQDLFQKFGQPVEDFAQSTSRSRGYLAIKMPWHQTADDSSSPVRSHRFELANHDPDCGPMMASDDPADPVSCDATLPEFGGQNAPETPPIILEHIPEEPAKPSITNMVDQLETAVALRHQKLAALSESMFGKMGERADLAAGLHSNDIEPTNQDEGRRPFLELVRSTPVTDGDADSALAAALATLERITVRAR